MYESKAMSKDNLAKHEKAESNTITVTGNVTIKQILLNTKGQKMKESNILRGNTSIKQL